MNFRNSGFGEASSPTPTQFASRDGWWYGLLLLLQSGGYKLRTTHLHNVERVEGAVSTDLHRQYANLAEGGFQI